MDKKYVVCANYPGCLCGFCYDCLRDKFGQDLEALGKRWICLVCHKLCRCERCLNKFGNLQNEIPVKNTKRTSKKDEKNISKTATKSTEKNNTARSKHAEENKKDKSSKTEKPAKSKADSEELDKPKRGRKRKNSETNKNTRATNEKPQQEETPEPATTKKAKGKGSSKEEKKGAKEDNNIVKIPMRQQAVPAMAAMQNPYIQHTDMQSQLQTNPQFSYLLVQQPLLGSQSYTSMPPADHPYVAIPMTEHAVWDETQKNLEKERKKRKINKEK
eukprot:TRINITY_DN1211_c0_g1_i1.p1 TRINITY_DN1211_c0_g1~~TRINITY_DN1211_c0_g1_i1.p1  ORF type:complete len:273 (+),score=89.83 TRINITY_DN1211_c0_g1_i1:345-1163(+)